MSVPVRAPAGRRLALLLAGLLASLLAALLFLEVLLRIGLYEALPIPIEAPVFRMDERGRIRLRPKVDLRSRGAEWDVRVITNRHAMRDIDRPASPTAVRILGLGDSFAFAWGVPMESGFLARAEDLLDRETRREIQIVKAAVPGWGPGDELEWLRESWDAWRPHVVLLVFVAGNDFYDTMVGGSRQYEVIEGIQIPKIRHASAFTPLKALLRRHSAAYRALAALWPGVSMRFAERRGRALHWRVNDIFLREPPAEARAAIDSTLAVLDEMRAFAAARGAAFAAVVVPSRAQIHADDFALFKARFAFRDQDLDMGRPQRVLAAWAARRGVPLLDLEPAMSAAAARDTTRLYFRNDSHWSAEGHRLAGRLVARFLLDRGLVRRDTSTE